MSGRHSTLPPPDPHELRRMLLHVLVRDYPETLAELERSGLETTQHGAETLEEALAHGPGSHGGGSLGGVESALCRVLEWRVSAGP